MYGHNIHDFLSAMMYVPEDLMKRGITVVRTKCCAKIMKEMMKFLGLNIKFVELKYAEQIFVKKLWIVHTMELAHGYASGGLTRLRKLIMQKVDFNKVKPTRFVVADRPPKSGRNFEDPDLIVEYLNNFTKIDEGCHWIRDDKFFHGHITDIVKYWQSIRVIVTLQGSGIYNAIFMHEKCGISILCSQNLDEPNLMLCAHLHIFLIEVVHPDRDFRTNKRQFINYTAMMKYTQRVVDAVNAGHWTSMEGIQVSLEPSYPATNAEEFVRNYNYVS
ncbi:hypothetical protein TVAG_217310 [Trichomonas vaginalis G3]|uniref:Glycosyltransferase 61 catalytic domain-containing protein n=1 Tax=Trichomonas vaginalis (strain ATCC PRA-98 / G3) TaxID=412133 RepID=A2EZB3_TRIV3|nr:glycosyltransferase family [Trichomonas vaginalis G3]EAY01994.1 hypothetical protein TVAG_217310 [Trichomonas vaginalis G3]KAI5546437.1 glycosyltransferase family [Trichomonas vaginalis G3]|eukprot:XP_001330474.1 hypothetical protein [Trichomonas vaginalis G3]